MEEIKKYRDASRQNSLGLLAVPGMRRTFTSQDNRPSIHAELQSLPETKIEGIQNPDGTFKFMADYSPLDGPDPLS